MIAYILRRIAWSVVLLFVVSWITYVLFFVIPTEQRAQTRRTTLAAESSNIRTAIPVHGTVFQEYGQFVWAVGHGSLGQSSTNRQDVVEILKRAAPVTAALVLGGAVLWLLIAIPVGILCAVRPRSVFDRSSTIFVLVGISAHPIWIGYMASYWLGYRLHVTPIGGYCDLFNPPPGASCGGPANWASHMMLPWFTFAMLFAALYVRMIRASVTEALDEDYVRTARAKGASELRVLRVHVLRTALLPVVTMLGMDIGLALGAAVFVEAVYGLPGLGSTLVAAIPRSDLPVIMGVVLVATIAILLLNLVVDVVYASVDPRVRLGRSVEVSE